MPRKFWRVVWRFYDSDWGGFLPKSFAPYLFGKSIGAKGTQVKVRKGDK